jgi:hypothetical protein
VTRTWLATAHYVVAVGCLAVPLAAEAVSWWSLPGAVAGVWANLRMAKTLRRGG